MSLRKNSNHHRLVSISLSMILVGINTTCVVSRKSTPVKQGMSEFKWRGDQVEITLHQVLDLRADDADIISTENTHIVLGNRIKITVDSNREPKMFVIGAAEIAMSASDKTILESILVTTQKTVEPRNGESIIFGTLMSHASLARVPAILFGSLSLIDRQKHQIVFDEVKEFVDELVDDGSVEFEFYVHKYGVFRGNLELKAQERRRLSNWVGGG